MSNRSNIWTPNAVRTIVKSGLALGGVSGFVVGAVLKDPEAGLATGASIGSAIALAGALIYLVDRNPSE
jgi:hypothetical protein